MKKERLNIRYDQAEERISKLEDKSFETEEQKEKRMKSEFPKGLTRYHQKYHYTYYTSFRRRRQQEKGTESLFKEKNGQKLPKSEEGNGT